MVVEQREFRQCQKCSWKWITRKKNSKQCPKCHTFNWDKNNPFVKELREDKKHKELSLADIKETKRIIKQISEWI